MTTWLERFEPPPGDGPTVAVKDLIDIAGVPTTCASRTVDATPADADAACVTLVRAAGGRIVGKTNLHELAFGGTGINSYTGTPVNPRNAAWIPGGSSSGSAVAVATGEADIALGTDTGGSIRTPAACCGVVGLKTSVGRIPTDGVRPLSPSLDTVGPMARTVAGVVTGMAMLEPGFRPAEEVPETVGRFRLPYGSRRIEQAIDRVIGEAGWHPVEVELRHWNVADDAGSMIAFIEASRVHSDVLRSHPELLGDDVRDRLEEGRRADAAGSLEPARAVGRRWRAELDRALARTPLLVLAGITAAPAPLDDPGRLLTRHPNVAVNLAGHPAIVLPIPGPQRVTTSLQLIAAHGREDLLCAAASRLEAAAATI